MDARQVFLRYGWTETVLRSSAVYDSLWLVSSRRECNSVATSEAAGLSSTEEWDATTLSCCCQCYQMKWDCIVQDSQNDNFQTTQTSHCDSLMAFIEYFLAGAFSDGCLGGLSVFWGRGGVGRVFLEGRIAKASMTPCWKINTCFQMWLDEEAETLKLMSIVTACGIGEEK